MLSEQLVEFWNRQEVRFSIDVARFVLIGLAVIIIVILLRDIEAVKVLAYDTCRVCMEKTGCTCTCIGNWANNMMNIS